MMRSHVTRGFTIVELVVIVVIIGVVAVFAVPSLLSSVERSKATEAFDYLATVHEAQEQYHAIEGAYAADIGRLDVELGTLEFFTVGEIGIPESESSLGAGWQLALTRSGASAGYGAYTVVFDHDGFAADESTIHADLRPPEPRNR